MNSMGLLDVHVKCLQWNGKLVNCHLELVT